MTDIHKEIDELKELIGSSERILITSHISPDPDAVASVLLMGMTLKVNFHDKKVEMVLEEEPLGLDFLAGYDQIKFKKLMDFINENKPDLLILLDANNLSRVSRDNADNIREYVKMNQLKTAIIDHHEPANREESEVYINQESPATAQDVYEVCFEMLKLQQPRNYAQLTMLGIYSDSGGFAYQNKRHTKTFKLVDELIAAGADVEKIINLTNQYTKYDMQVFAELARNVCQQDDYSYSYIADEFVDAWLASGKTGVQLHKGTEAFVNHFIRNIEGRLWGFIVYKNPLQNHMYSASLRSVGSSKDVSKIAAVLGGGGHKPAAGAKFEAASLKEALDKVKVAIASA